MRSTKFGLLRWVPADSGMPDQRQEQVPSLREDDDPSGYSPRKRPRGSSTASPPGGSNRDVGSAGTSSLSHEFAGDAGYDVVSHAFASFTSYEDADGDIEVAGHMPASGGGPRLLSRYGEPKYSPGDDHYKLGGMWLLVSVIYRP